MVAPDSRPPNAVHWAAACMSGGAANHVPAPADAVAASESAVATSLPPMPDTKMSAWRHSTALGEPVVPPVHTRYRSSGDGVGRSSPDPGPEPEPAATAASKPVLPSSGAVPDPSSTSTSSTVRPASASRSSGPSDRW